MRTDTIGNFIASRTHSGIAHDAPRLILGSHLDTVDGAGRYDGVLGVLVGVAVLEALTGESLPFAIEVVGFCDEEGARFARPYLGSATIAGCFDPDWLELSDRDGCTLRQAVRDFGGDPERISADAYPPASLLGYVETHIEQGPILERLGSPLAVVDSIAGQERLSAQFLGRSGHAGTEPMDGRQDAACAAAQMITAVHEIGCSTSGLRATCGRVELQPNLSNVIAQEATLTIDVRHPSDETLRSAIEQLLRVGEEIAARERVRFSAQTLGAECAAVMDATLSTLLAEAVEAQGLSVHQLSSGAGHDAAVMARATRAAMLFLRSPGGVSHHPEESVVAEDIPLAIRALRHFVLRLAGRKIVAEPSAPGNGGTK